MIQMIFLICFFMPKSEIIQDFSERHFVTLGEVYFELLDFDVDMVLVTREIWAFESVKIKINNCLVLRGALVDDISTDLELYLYEPERSDYLQTFENLDAVVDSFYFSQGKSEEECLCEMFGYNDLNGFLEGFFEGPFCYQETYDRFGEFNGWIRVYDSGWHVRVGYLNELVKQGVHPNSIEDLEVFWLIFYIPKSKSFDQWEQ